MRYAGDYTVIRVRVDISDVLSELREFPDNMDDAVDYAVGQTSKQVSKDFKKALIQNDKKVSGTAVNSVVSMPVGDGRRQIQAASYLDRVYTGTPPHEPTVHNRLRTWASQRGWKLSKIIQHLRNKGSKPHRKWWKSVTNKTSKTIKKRTRRHLKKILSR